MVSSMVTFFTSYDYWRFNLISTVTKPCGKCQYYTGVGVLTGDLLQGMFPYLKVVDDDEIKCNIHPNCRCFLSRVLLAYNSAAILVPEAVLAQSMLLLTDYRLRRF